MQAGLGQSVLFNKARWPGDRAVRRARQGRYRRVMAPAILPARRQRWPGILILGLAVMMSASLHGLVWFGWGNKTKARQEKSEARRIEVSVIQKAKSAEPAPRPLPEKQKPLAPVPKKTMEPKPPDTPPPLVQPPLDTPPPSNSSTDAVSPTAPVYISGISLSSTSNQGSIKVAVGNTLYGKPPEKAPAPLEVKPYKAKEYSPPHLLSEPPEFLDNVTEEQMRSFYPEQARKNNMEGEVRVRLTIDDDGSVVQVRLLEDAGHGFGEAAQKLARLYRFKPARVNGRSVATEVPFTVRFELK